MKKQDEIFIITPLWDFLSPTTGVLTVSKYKTLKRITGRFKALLKKKGYEVSSVAEMADLNNLSDYDILTTLQDRCYIDTFLENVHQQIDNCEYVTVIPVNIMCDNFVNDLKTQYLDRYISISQLLEISNEEIARQVQNAIESLKKQQDEKKNQIKKSRRPNKKRISANKERSLTKSVSVSRSMR